ncbi:MAG: hypothetical protein ACJZ85_00500 [Pontiellaceae bacterium]|nr:hypothetical protein [Kiritimatiellaceae bacterium]|tara:strand:+ start:2462 stop:2791 length:330 start_codon:yes stop_codon:yes gene_type:complete
MKSKLHALWLLLIFNSQLLITGCQKESPSFLFWCVRPELVTKEIYIEKIDDAVKQSVDANFKKMDGFVSSSWNSNLDTLTITYKASEVRYMNFERVLIRHKLELQTPTE